MWLLSFPRPPHRREKRQTERRNDVKSEKINPTKKIFFQNIWNCGNNNYFCGDYGRG